jgi:murein DD-endopeptidase MepM/ murein hydrolase activator NlpD
METMWKSKSFRNIARVFMLFCMGFFLAFSDRTLAEPTSEDQTATQKIRGEPIAAVSLDRILIHKRFDYSRFSNGPKWVPQPRGTALERANALGLGTLQSARRLLHTPPEQAVLAGCKGDRPKTLLWPVVGGKWGRGFGYTRTLRPELRHDGVDIGAPKGASVRAAADGIVAYSDNGLRGFGNVVLIIHPNGWSTLYAHNLRNTVQAGWRVKRGERIALVGATGLAQGPHLHFEFRNNGKLGDPARYFVGNRSNELSGPLIELQ